MSGGIALTPDRAWMVAGWVFGRLIEGARARVAPNSEIDYWLQVGLANNLVALDMRDPVLASDMIDVLVATAADDIRAIRAGRGPRTTDDGLYCRALVDLLTMLGPDASDDSTERTRP